jgi:hypothetical protein
MLSAYPTFGKFAEGWGARGKTPMDGSTFLVVRRGALLRAVELGHNMRRFRADPAPIAAGCGYATCARCKARLDVFVTLKADAERHAYRNVWRDMQRTDAAFVIVAVGAPIERRCGT